MNEATVAVKSIAFARTAHRNFDKRVKCEASDTFRQWMQIGIDKIPLLHHPGGTVQSQSLLTPPKFVSGARTVFSLRPARSMNPVQAQCNALIALKAVTAGVSRGHCRHLAEVVESNLRAVEFKFEDEFWSSGSWSVMDQGSSFFRTGRKDEMIAQPGNCFVEFLCVFSSTKIANLSADGSSDLKRIGPQINLKAVFFFTAVVI